MPRYIPFLFLISIKCTLTDQAELQIQAWVEDAKVHWKQAKWHREIGILDFAYVEFLLAFTIVADIIPRCSGFPTFKTSGSRSPSYIEFEQLSKVCFHEPEWDSGWMLTP